MKREILCPSCAQRAVAIPNAQTFTAIEALQFREEHHKIVHGKLLGGKICDACSTLLEKGAPAAAFSIWSDLGGVPYYEWESDYLDLSEAA